MIQSDFGTGNDDLILEVQDILHIAVQLNEKSCSEHSYLHDLFTISVLIDCDSAETHLVELFHLQTFSPSHTIR